MLTWIVTLFDDLAESIINTLCHHPSWYYDDEDQIDYDL